MFDIGLGIVKVSIDRDDMGIVPSLSGHLQFLHLADTVFWIKDDSFSTWNIGKTCHGSFTSVPGCRCQDDDFIFQTVLLAAVVMK